MESFESNLGKLNEESLKRKERLRKLREKAAKNEANTYESGSYEKLPRPIFRSYKPQDVNTFGELYQKPSGDIEMAVESQLDLLKDPMTIDEIDITNLAPRKSDWDLKREVAKKLERMERRTQKAIAELIRERLKNNQHEDTDIFQAVNVGTAHAGESKNNEDD